MTSSQPAMRILIFVQHILGIGHIQRMLYLANELKQQGAQILLINGGKKVRIHPYLSSQDVVHLPPIFCQNHSFDTYYTYESNIKNTPRPLTEQDQEARKNQILSLYQKFKPDYLLIESFPFGRHFFRFELLPLLDQAKKDHVKIGCSIRDILVIKEAEKQKKHEEKTHALLNQYFDEVISHNDQRLCDLSFSFKSLHEVKIPIHYLGYITQPPKLTYQRLSQKEMPRPLIWASGGGDQPHLLRQMQNSGLGKCQGNLDVYLPTSIKECNVRMLRHRFSKIRFKKFSPHYRSHITQAQISISQAGYNTILDLLGTTVHAFLSPLSSPSENEQVNRALLLTHHPNYKHQFHLVPQRSYKNYALAFLIRRHIAQKKKTSPIAALAFKKYASPRALRKTALHILTQMQPASKASFSSAKHQFIDTFKKAYDQGNHPRFWLRDDDLTKPSKALERFISLNQTYQIPSHMAVVPEQLDTNLASSLSPHQNQIVIFQHGYGHHNHAVLQNEKKIELGGNYAIDQARNEILKGKTLLEKTFGSQFMPIMVPPWNRINATFISQIIEPNYVGLSTFASKIHTQKIPQINCHIDIINWKEKKGALSQDEFYTQLNLQIKNKTPLIGLLSHHLVMSNEHWTLLERFFDLIRSALPYEKNLMASLTEGLIERIDRNPDISKT